MGHDEFRHFSGPGRRRAFNGVTLF